jgi:hypothetical protein
MIFSFQKFDFIHMKNRVSVLQALCRNESVASQRRTWLGIGQQQSRLSHGHTGHFAFDPSLAAGFLLIGDMQQAKFQDRYACRGMAQGAALQQLPSELDRVTAQPNVR